MLHLNQSLDVPTISLSGEVDDRQIAELRSATRELAHDWPACRVRLDCREVSSFDLSALTQLSAMSRESAVHDESLEIENPPECLRGWLELVAAPWHG